MQGHRGDTNLVHLLFLKELHAFGQSCGTTSKGTENYSENGAWGVLFHSGATRPQKYGGWPASGFFRIFDQFSTSCAGHFARPPSGTCPLLLPYAHVISPCNTIPPSHAMSSGDPMYLSFFFSLSSIFSTYHFFTSLPFPSSLSFLPFPIPLLLPLLFFLYCCFPEVTYGT